MKKSLIALAALAASGAVFAQSSVTLFGVVDLAYENVKTNAGRVSGLAPSANSSSRIGFRGVEDLGGGMSASFWLEAAIAPQSGIGSSGTSQFNQSANIAAGGLTFNRRSTVSLSSGFGELRLGRDYSPSFWNYALFDPFGANSVGAAIGNFTGNSLSNTFVRSSNSVGYFLPANLGGIYGQAMYAFGNRASSECTGPAGTTAAALAAAGCNVASAPGGATPAAAQGIQHTDTNGRYMGARLGYAQGPVNVAVSYARTTFAPGTNAISAFGYGATSGTFTDTSVGGSYTFGSIKAMAMYFRQKATDVAFANPTITAAPVVLLGDETIKGWGIGADWGVGAGDVLLSYSTAKLSGLSNPKATKWALGYVHNLSKRTAVYAYYSHVGNKGGSALTAGSFSSGGLGAVAPAISVANPTANGNVNGSSTGIDIGLRHAF